MKISYYVGLEENGEPVHGSMYRDLFVNGPKEMSEFVGYTFKEHFKRPVPSFMPREVFLDYLQGKLLVLPSRKDK